MSIHNIFRSIPNTQTHWKRFCERHHVLDVFWHSNWHSIYYYLKIPNLTFCIKSRFHVLSRFTMIRRLHVNCINLRVATFPVIPDNEKISMNNPGFIIDWLVPAVPHEKIIRLTIVVWMIHNEKLVIMIIIRLWWSCTIR